MKKAARAIIVRDNHLLVMKRNKFGHQYYTLIGGGVEIDESNEQALVREVHEETGLIVKNAKLVMIEEAGVPYGTQYIFLCQDPGGEINMQESAIESQLNKMGQNLYTPMWLPYEKFKQTDDLLFRSEKLRSAIVRALENGFSNKPEKI
jgi:ADP-ribose pyrophosphatase YjhB (NUDIX family)